MQQPFKTGYDRTSFDLFFFELPENSFGSIAGIGSPQDLPGWSTKAALPKAVDRFVRPQSLDCHTPGRGDIATWGTFSDVSPNETFRTSTGEPGPQDFHLVRCCAAHLGGPSAHYWDALGHGRRFKVNHCRTVPAPILQPGVSGEFHGVPDRLDQCVALGNAICPPLFAEIFRTIEAVEGWNSSF